MGLTMNDISCAITPGLYELVVLIVLLLQLIAAVIPVYSAYRLTRHTEDDTKKAKWCNKQA